MNGSRVRNDGCGRSLGISNGPKRGRRRPSATGNEGMKKVLELALEAIFQSFLPRHLSIIRPARPDGKLQDRYPPPNQCYSDAVMSGDR